VPEPQKTYYAAVSRADRQVGRVLDLLDQLGIANNTLVMFSSDNGPENSHSQPGQKFYHSQGSTGGLRGRKRSLLMGGVNVPFLVRWPGVVPAGRVDKETALAAVDVFPTVLAATGAKAPEGYISDGESMLAAFKGEKQARTKPVFWWCQAGHTGDDWPAFAMREGSHVLILDVTKQRVELFDVISDRFQTNNLATAEPERVKRMTTAIDDWFGTLPKTVDPALRAKAAPKPAAKPAEITPETRLRAFKNWDKNQDDHLTLEEYRNGLAKKDNVETRFKNFDQNGDGKVTREEFAGKAAP
jgi:N-acetylgalactosamine-6-sulfatase